MNEGKGGKRQENILQHHPSSSFLSFLSVIIHDFDERADAVKYASVCVCGGVALPARLSLSVHRRVKHTE